MYHFVHLFITRLDVETRRPGRPIQVVQDETALTQYTHPLLAPGTDTFITRLYMEQGRVIVTYLPPPI